MRYKPGVNLEGVQPPTWWALGIADRVFKAHGVDMIVTSLTDGIHPDAKNIHGRGYAADIRTNGTTADLQRSIVAELKQILFPLGYDVVLEADHLHCEFDPKPGREVWAIQV